MFVKKELTRKDGIGKVSLILLNVGGRLEFWDERVSCPESWRRFV